MKSSIDSPEKVLGAVATAESSNKSRSKQEQNLSGKFTAMVEEIKEEEDEDEFFDLGAIGRRKQRSSTEPEMA